MKRLALYCIIYFITFSSVAEETETFLQEKLRVKGFGSPIVKMTQVHGEFDLIIGARGAVLLNRAFAIGIGAYSLASSIHVAETKSNFEMEYAGLVLEFVFPPDKRVHLSANTLIGWGGLNNAADRNWMYYNDYDAYYGDDRYYANHNPVDDSFMVIEPELDLELNMTTFFRLSLGVSYRYVSGVGLMPLTNADLKGLAAVFTFKVGKF
ncbi:TPA: hypothetical protein EYO77_01270 [Candidatus Poribacteria bacterium]|nr:hypothetical protein [Candidatus Poribacteria bacterium]HIM12028.1 hypothetical protein [Candidatus Poribacteria bacterium]HIN31122.1 hypothetical protein [Candidatus Poribacteria bacterium]HIO48234.1 hypothetical protein [Candidatus Poribacteria bacterium]